MGAIGAILTVNESQIEHSTTLSLDKLNDYLERGSEDAQHLPKLYNKNHRLIKDTFSLNGQKKVTGYLEKVIYDYQDADTGADLTITMTDIVSEPLLTVTDAGTADVTWYPRSLGNKIADASAFTDVGCKMFLTDASFKVVVAQGGNAKDVRLLFVVSDQP